MTTRGPVRGSTTGRPVMLALDVLGRRATLRVLWELRDGPLTFRELQSAADTNPATLNTRLKELRGLDVVAHDEGGYRLTRHGHELMEALRPLQQWADSWDTRDSAGTAGGRSGARGTP
jgi:DNA-binding HxlR family transcriptional regulator